MQRRRWKQEMLSVLISRQGFVLKGHFSAEAAAAESRSAWDESCRSWREGWSGAGEKPLAKSQRKDVHSCCLQWQCRLRDLMQEHLRHHHKPSSQRPPRMWADFRDRVGEKIIHSRLGYLPWIIAEPKCWKRVCLACRHLKGGASQEENSLCYVSSSEHLYFIWRPDDEKVQGAKSQSRLDSPNDYTSLSTGLRTLQAEIKASLLPASPGTTSTPLPLLLSKCNICEERKELVHLGR